MVAVGRRRAVVLSCQIGESAAAASPSSLSDSAVAVFSLELRSCRDSATLSSCLSSLEALSVSATSQGQLRLVTAVAPFSFEGPVVAAAAASASAQAARHCDLQLVVAANALLAARPGLSLADAARLAQCAMVGDWGGGRSEEAGVLSFVCSFVRSFFV